MPDLGRRLQIGSLYDAVSEQPTTGFLWPPHLTAQHTHTTPAQYSAYDFTSDDYMSDKTSLLDLAAEVKMSFMGGLIKVSGSASYLNDRKSTSRAVRMSTAFKVRTIKQTLDVFNGDLPLDGPAFTKVLDNQIATHVVTAVTWGANCVATFEQKFNTFAEREQIAGHLQGFMRLGPTTASGSIDLNLDQAIKERTESTSVTLRGDVVPFGNSTLPTTPVEALAFMKSLHLHGLSGGGVPMELTLMPITWLDSRAARLKRAITSEMVDRAVAISDELDESETLINDLLSIEVDGFLNFRWEVESWLSDMRSWRGTYINDMKGAILVHRNSSSDTNALSAVLAAYEASPYTLLQVRKGFEMRQDTIMNLKAMVKPLQNEGRITVAESFSDYQAPTLDGTYDRVYALVLVGMNPARARSSMDVVRRFFLLAKSRLTSKGGPDVAHCKVAREDETDKCVETLKFVSLHFETFCHQLCDEMYCAADYVRCSSSGSSSRTGELPGEPAWCHCPTTEVLEYVRSGDAALVTDRMPALPRKPVIINHSGAEEGQQSPTEQQITLELAVDDRVDLVSNFLVQVIWHESSVKNGSDRVLWTRHQRTFDTYGNSPTIVVRPLVAGQRYRFAVSGVGALGEGPPSDEYPVQEPMMIFHNTAIIYPQVPTGESQNNTVPSWKRTPVYLTMSTKVYSPLARAVLLTGSGPVDCERVLGQSLRGFNCTIPMLASQHDTIVRVEVHAISGEIVGWGNLTISAPGASACYAHESVLKLYCELKGTCVSTCDECKLNSEVSKEMLHGDGSATCARNPCSGAGSLFCPLLADLKVPCVDRDSTLAQQGCEECSIASSGIIGSLAPNQQECVIPCVVQVPSMVSKVLCGSSVRPGATCALSCALGYHATGVQSLIFACSENNTERLHMPDASTLGCETSNEALTPVGSVIMWAGSVSSIPQYWALCDGSNGTPDLRDRFIFGCGTSGCGERGGTTSYAMNSAGAHGHDGSIEGAGSHSHGGSTSSAGSHSHGDATGVAGDSVAPGYERTNGAQMGPWAHNLIHRHAISSDGNHNHVYTTNVVGTHNHGLTINSNGAHTHTISDARPPYYSLAFIMYVGVPEA